MKKKITGIVAVLTILSGCASFKEFTDRHPVATGIGATLIVGSVAIAAKGDSKPPSAAAIGDANKPPCRAQPDGSCR
jgi:hypothetical protein